MSIFRSLYYLPLVMALASITVPVKQVHGYAGESDSSEETSSVRADSDGVRLHYNNENAPDAILFWHFLDSLYVDSVAKDGSRKRYLKPGITENSDADALFDYFVERYRLVNDEIRQVKMDVLSCDDVHGRPLGRPVIRLLDELDKLEVAIYAKHLAISSVELSIRATYDLEKAIANSPSNFYRSRDSYESRASVMRTLAGIDDPATVLVDKAGVDALCTSLAENFQHDVEVE